MRDLQRLRILSSVRQAFYSVLLTERRIEVQERLAALASEAVGVTAQLFNVGAADRPDFLEIEIESRRLQLQLDRSRNELFAQRARSLRRSTGVREVADRPLAGAHRCRRSRARARHGHPDAAGTEPGDARRTGRARANPGRHRSRADVTTFPDLFLRGGGAYNREHGEDTGRPIGWEGTLEAGVSVPLVQPERRRHCGRARRRGARPGRTAATRASRSSRGQRRVCGVPHGAAGGRSVPHRDPAARRGGVPALPVAYREMAAAYPQVLVAQRTFFEMSTEYLESLNEAWRAALQLQGFLAGDGLEAPATAGAESEMPSTGRGGER